jgi:hypothetical protein
MLVSHPKLSKTDDVLKQRFLTKNKKAIPSFSMTFYSRVNLNKNPSKDGVSPD